MSNYIVAIDLGTSHITGIVGEKKTNGSFSIVAIESVETETCIHRGIIYDSDETATFIKTILSKLERNLKGDYIDKIYIGVGGQSLHTIDHVESMQIEEGASVTEEDIATLEEQCKKYKPDLKDVLCIAHVVYYVNGLKCTKPVGVLGDVLEAHYKLVVGRSSIRHRITKSIETIHDKELAGVIVSPIALADAVLSSRDKELGCALVDFGAGVTSVSIFKDGDLQHLCVIPLGGKMITRDISTLQLTKDDAEKLKKEKGSAILLNEEDDEIIPIEMEGAEREIKKSDLNMIIEGRTREIVENVYARIQDVIELKQLGAGIVLAGGGSELMNLPELLNDKCRGKVRTSTIKIGLVEDSDEMQGNPSYMMAISLMMKGTEACTSSVNGNNLEGNNHNTPEGTPIENPITDKVIIKNPDVKVNPPIPRRGFKEKVKDIFVTRLFEEEG